MTPPIHGDLNTGSSKIAPITLYQKNSFETVFFVLFDKMKTEIMQYLSAKMYEIKVKLTVHVPTFTVTFELNINDRNFYVL